MIGKVNTCEIHKCASTVSAQSDRAQQLNVSVNAPVAMEGASTMDGVVLLRLTDVAQGRKRVES